MKTKKKVNQIILWLGTLIHESHQRSTETLKFEFKVYNLGSPNDSSILMINTTIYACGFVDKTNGNIRFTFTKRTFFYFKNLFVLINTSGG